MSANFQWGMEEMRGLRGISIENIGGFGGSRLGSFEGRFEIPRDVGIFLFEFYDGCYLCIEERTGATISATLNDITLLNPW